MHKKSSFIKLLAVTIGVLSVQQATAQSGWQVGLSTGAGFPITGYKGVFKNGWLLGAEGGYRFGKGNFAVGMQTDFVRLQNDKNPVDTFHNARITIAPILFMAEYELETRGAWKPYIAGGMGVSLFNFTYDTTPTEGQANFNVSFTLSPQLGVRYKASEYLYPFLAGKAVLLMDGPPQGFPKSDKVTGYTALAAGLQYRF
jgi:opacity protein-like surface antigen